MSDKTDWNALAADIRNLKARFLDPLLRIAEHADAIGSVEQVAAEAEQRRQIALEGEAEAGTRLEAAQKALDDAVNAEAAARKQVDAMLATAREKADSIAAEALREADKTRALAMEDADEIRKSAEADAKAIADKAAAALAGTQAAIDAADKALAARVEEVRATEERLADLRAAVAKVGEAFQKAAG